MKISLLAAAAFTAATMTFSAGAVAGPSHAPKWKPHGTQAGKVYRPAPRVVAHRHAYRPVYRPGRAALAIGKSAANVAALRRKVYADGRVTLVERIKLRAAERRHATLVRSMSR